MTATRSLVLPPGEGRRIVTKAHEVTFKVTGGQSRAASTFEALVPPGFDCGAHLHGRTEELFYVLDGELEMLAFEPRVRGGDSWEAWESAEGDRIVRAGPGTLVHVPPRCPHAFANRSGAPARMLFQASPPPDHERYFEELLDILEPGGPVDHVAIEELRRRYDIEQLTPLRHAPA